jgi:hypothetical protein
VFFVFIVSPTTNLVNPWRSGHTLGVNPYHHPSQFLSWLVLNKHKCICLRTTEYGGITCNPSSRIQSSYKFLPNRRKAICNKQRSATTKIAQSDYQASIQSTCKNMWSCRQAYIVAKEQLSNSDARLKESSTTVLCWS